MKPKHSLSLVQMFSVWQGFRLLPVAPLLLCFALLACTPDAAVQAPLSVESGPVVAEVSIDRRALLLAINDAHVEQDVYDDQAEGSALTRRISGARLAAALRSSQPEGEMSTTLSSLIDEALLSEAAHSRGEVVEIRVFRRVLVQALLSRIGDVEVSETELRERYDSVLAEQQHSVEAVPAYNDVKAEIQQVMIRERQQVALVELFETLGIDGVQYAATDELDRAFPRVTFEDEK